MYFRLFMILCSLSLNALPPTTTLVSREHRVTRQYRPERKPKLKIKCITYISYDPQHPAILTLCEVKK